MGTGYYGSQRLTARGKIGDLNTVQEALENALDVFLPKRKASLTAASRTDKGVHALMNVYTLPLMDFSIPTSRIRTQVNINLARKNQTIMYLSVKTASYVAFNTHLIIEILTDTISLAYKIALRTFYSYQVISILGKIASVESTSTGLLFSRITRVID